ncbi:MAG: alpha/beta hydrolase [Candidatus Dadabacteria bacterium]|nr:MAG: alpha/beta hydrolase [Candidatus Dadabacteria bacterium]
MTDSIFDTVQSTADLLGACEPLWLRERKEPEFITVEQGQEGPPLLLLHGLFGALSNWESVQPLMANYARTIALSFPILSGHRSEVKVKALTVYTEYFVRKRQLAPVTLCGNSLGGHVALRFALARPELVNCLILSGASGLYEHSVDSLPVRPGEEFVREHMARVFYSREFITDQAVDEITKIVKDRVKQLNLIHSARSAKKDNLLNELKNIKVPTLLLWGEDDLVTTMDVAETFHSNIPNSKLVTIKNCGHAPMIEHPKWFADQVKNFLEVHSSS